MLPQTPLQLHGVATWDAHVLHVCVLDVEQRLHVVEPAPEDELRVLVQAGPPEEGHHRVVPGRARPGWVHVPVATIGSASHGFSPSGSRAAPGGP